MNARRLAKWSMGTLAVMALLCGLLWAVLFHSEAGARWGWSRLAGDGLSAGTVSGTIASGLSIRHLRYSSDTIDLLADEVQIEARAGLWPLSIRLSHLYIETLELETISATQPDPGEPVSWDEGFGAPLPIAVDQLEIRRLMLRDSDRRDAAGPFRLLFSGYWDDRIEAAPLRLENDEFHVEVTGFAEMQAPFDHRLAAEIQLPASLTAILGMTPISLVVRTEGSSDLTELTVTDPGGHIDLEGQLSHWLTRPVWSLAGSVTDLSLAGQSNRSNALLLRTLQLQAGGTLQDFNLDVLSQARQPVIGDFTWHVSGTGDESGLQRLDGRLEAQCLKTTFDAAVLWSADVSARVDSSLEWLDPSCWIEHWPGGHPFHGEADIAWHEETLSVSNLDIALENSDAKIFGNGLWQPGKAFREVRLEWSNLHWPLDADPRLESPAGTITLDGLPEAWRLDGTLNLLAAGYPEALLILSGNGDATSATIALSRSAMLGGTLQGLVQARWDGPFAWSAELDADSFDLGAVWPEWPAIIDADLLAAQDPSGEGIVVRLDELSGTLRGEAISGSGAIRLAQDSTSFQKLQLSAPNSRLEIDGDLGRGLDFSVDAARPGLFSNLAGVEIRGTGRIQGSLDQPEIELDLTLDGLQLDESAVGRMIITGEAGPNLPMARLSAEMEEISLGGMTWQSANMVLGNIDGLQRFTFTATGEEVGLDALLEGRLSGWLETNRLAWDGHWLEMRITPQDQPSIELRKPASMNLAPERFELGDACLSIAGDDAFCIDAVRLQDGAFALDSRILSLPLQRLADFSDLDIEFSQTLNGQLEWRQDAGSAPSGSMQLSLSPGMIRHTVEKLDEIETGPGTFGFLLEQGQLRQGHLRLPLVNIGGVQIDYAISDVALDGTGQLDGRARVEIEDLYPFAVFLPYLSNLSGGLSIDTKIGGVTANPDLDGLVVLENAVFDVPALGLGGVQLQLDGRVSREDRLAVQGSLAIGEGAADIEGLLDVEQWDAPSLNVLVSGRGLPVIDLPNLRITADPDLELGWRPDAWTIGGDLVIPMARVTPNEAVVDRVTESGDVVIVAGGGEEGRATEAPEHSITGLVQVSVGDDVRVETPTFSLDAKGKLELEWTGPALPVATGGILLNGEIRSYGPRLQVERGRLRFQGGTIDDPQLDIRAERDIFGNTQIQTAGIRIAGTARRPLVEAYTHPVTTEERAWTLLVTGSDFQYGEGVGAFDIGTYIAPRLYISYGISLVDEARTVSARYDLRRGFGIKATSSQEDNGVDISYTIER